MSRCRALGSIALALLLSLVSGRARAQRFVSVQNGRFVVDGATLRFLGGNASVMHGARERAALGTTLDAIAADGGKVVRVWALGESPSGSPDWKRDYAFRIGPDGFVETSYAHLDAVLEAARARHLRVIVVLANRWHDYGGFPEYLRWCDPEASFEASGNIPMAMLGRFYGSSAARALYRAHVERIVTRVNARTGVAYRDDETIFAWELANETLAQSDEDQASLVTWTREEAAFVKSLDPNHLVGAGHIGYDTLRERDAWLEVDALDVVDYADVHLYPLGDRRVTSARTLSSYLRDRVALAHGVLHKPLLIGEFGFDGSADSLRHRSRRAWTRGFLAEAERLGVAGALVWFYEPSDDSRRLHTLPATPTGLAHPVRATLRALAPAFARDRAPGLATSGREPIFRERVVDRGTTVHRFAARGGGFVLEGDALAIEEASFEREGRYEGSPVAHLWGTGEGSVRYRFVAPNAPPPVRLAVRVFASSELDGRGLGARPSETSLVRAYVDDVEVARFEAPVDDGLGHPVEIVVDDVATLDRIFRTRGATHRLRFEAASRPGAGGLCLYGAVAEGVDESVARASDRAPSLRVTWTPR